MARPTARTALIEAVSFSSLLADSAPKLFLTLLGEHIRTRRWFRGKARSISGLEIVDHVLLRAAPRDLALVFVRVHYAAGAPEVYVVPLAFAQGDEADDVHVATSTLFVLQIVGFEVSHGMVYDPTGSDDLSQLLLEMASRAKTPGETGHLTALPSEALKVRLSAGQPRLSARVPSGEQSNTTVFYGQELILKLFRQLEAGDNPDVELNQFLWASGYRHIPEPLGSVRFEGGPLQATLAIVQRFVPSQGSAWDVTLQMLQRAFERVRARGYADSEPLMPSDDLLDSSQQNPPENLVDLVGEYAPLAQRLGERTAELHVALASDRKTPGFKPEPFDAAYQTAIVQAARERVATMFELLNKQLPKLPEASRGLAHEALGCRDALDSKLDAARSVRVTASRIRCHGDYHLGQVLYGNEDFIILDFEGEPAQPLDVRRQKLSALYDVCGMLRSFHYAATVALQSDQFRPDERAALASWSEAWYRWTSASFLNAYLRTARAQAEPPVFLPDSPDALRALLRLHTIDKCSYELGYELNNRPAWVGVPLAGLISLAKSR
jgi:maltose alpha-D-glucosyltransferase/alpha-amylase